MHKVFILILHFGESEVTNECLDSLFKREKYFSKVIVIDNSQNFILSKNLENKDIRIITTKKNLGFSGGVNFGINHVLSENPDYILLLNNDTIIKEEFIKRLVDILDADKTAGIVGPAIKSIKKGKLMYDLGGRVNKTFGRTSHKEVYKISDSNASMVDYVSGCAMLIKEDALRNVGLFDEQFFLYYEDVDYCIRAKNKDFETFIVPSVFVEHRLSKSVGGVSSLALYHQTRSAILFGKKYFSKKIAFNLAFIFAQSFYIFIKNPKVGKFTFLALYQNI